MCLTCGAQTADGLLPACIRPLHQGITQMQHTPLPKRQAPAGDTTSHGASPPHRLCRPSQTQHMSLPCRQRPAAAVASHGPWVFEMRRNAPQSHVGEPQDRDGGSLQNRRGGRTTALRKREGVQCGQAIDHLATSRPHHLKLREISLEMRETTRKPLPPSLAIGKRI